MSDTKTCAGGFPKWGDRCPNPVPAKRDGYTVVLWCDDCEKLRIAHLSAAFAGIQAEFPR